MPKEYRTIREVAGPLMMISDVDDVKYDELGEIELPNGETRRCKVLEVEGSNALVQLFESAAGINLADSKVRFLGRSMELPVSPDMLSRVFDGLGNPIDDGPALIPEKRLDSGCEPVAEALYLVRSHVGGIVTLYIDIDYLVLFRALHPEPCGRFLLDLGKVDALLQLKRLLRRHRLLKEKVLPRGGQSRLRLVHLNKL